MEVTAAFVAGLLALIGGYFGAWAARRTDYEKWIRQERGVVFSAFLQKVHETFAKTVDVLHDSDLDDAEADQAITELFFALEPQKNIVRLYLPEKERAQFSDLVQQLWAAQIRSLDQGARMKITHRCMSAIQDVFERRLHD